MFFFDKIKSLFGKKKTKYIGCYSTSTFHKPGCKCIKTMNRDNLIFYDPSVSYKELVGLKMKPCSKCKPR